MEDVMHLWRTTRHENSRYHLTPLFSSQVQAIFIAVAKAFRSSEKGKGILYTRVYKRFAGDVLGGAGNWAVTVRDSND